MNGRNDVHGMETLFELNGLRFVIEESMGLWVKFDVWRVACTSNIPQGFRYSLTLHDRQNQRIMGFDNAHAPLGLCQGNPAFDHYHRCGVDRVDAYKYLNPGKLLEDFWIEVDKTIKILGADHAKKYH